jgi:predicted metal-dependent enzyme (double-stranded beta helix superfamily)
MFEIQQLVDSCRAALGEHSPTAAVRDVVREAISDPVAVHAAFGEPARAEVATLHQAPDLTVLHIVWGPGMAIYPHDHRMWAVIGVFGGREDNTFFKRSRSGSAGSGLDRAGAKELGERDAVVLGAEVIHAVANPSARRFTSAIHVYGGDFFAQSRSEWNPETLTERPYEVEHLRALFAEANERIEAERGG